MPCVRQRVNKWEQPVWLLLRAQTSHSIGLRPWFAQNHTITSAFMSVGLKAGKTYTPDLPGEVVTDLPAPAAAEGDAAEDSSAAGDAAAAAADAGVDAPPTARQHAGRQQGQESRQAAAKPTRQEKQQAKKQQQQQQEKEANREARQQVNLTFSAYDRQVLQQMPAWIREQVPFLTTAKGAIDTTLLQLLKLLAVSDVGFANLVNRLHELHHWQYYKQMLVYYSFAASVKQVERANRGELFG